MMAGEQEPLEGFQITGYDACTKTVTIEIHPLILKYPRQIEALVMRCIEIVNKGDEVAAVSIAERNSGLRSAESNVLA